MSHAEILLNLDIRKTALSVPVPAGGAKMQTDDPSSNPTRPILRESPRRAIERQNEENQNQVEPPAGVVKKEKKKLFATVEEEVKHAEASRLALKSSFTERAKDEYDPTKNLQSPLVERNDVGSSFNVRTTFGRERLSKLTFYPHKPRDRSRFRILLVRHGQSLANVDPLLYTRISDHAVPLSQRGVEQAMEIGTLIRDFYKKEPYPNESPYANYRRLWVSPYKRARETASAMFETAGDCIADFRESIYLGEQQFGLFEGLSPSQVAKTHPIENEHFNKAIKYGGRFWARMPLGESRYDVAARVERLFDRLYVDQEKHGIEDVIIVAHGATCRAFAMMWLRRTPEWFENEPNGENCAIRLIEGTTDKRYIFNGFGRETNAAPHKSEMSQKLEKGSSGELAREKENEEAAINLAKQKEQDLRSSPRRGGPDTHPTPPDPTQPVTTTPPAINLQVPQPTIISVEERNRKVEEELAQQQREWEREKEFERQKREEEKEKEKEKEEGKDLQLSRSGGEEAEILSLLKGGDVLNLLVQMKREMDAMKNELESFKHAFHTTVFVDRSDSWRNYMQSNPTAPKWMTVAKRNLSLPVRSHVTVNAHGMGIVVDDQSNHAALYVSIFFNGHIFSKVSGPYGHGTAISHSHSWVPVVSMASLELEPGEQVIELCFSMGDGSPDGRTTVFYNGGIMVTTVYPILVTSYDTLDSK